MGKYEKMTEKDITETIKKHSVRAIIIVAVITVICNVLAIYVFDGELLSPLLIIILAVGTTLYSVQKVLVDLLVTKEG